LAYIRPTAWWMGRLPFSWCLWRGLLPQTHHVGGRLLGRLRVISGRWCSVYRLSLCGAALHWSWCRHLVCYWVSLLRISLIFTKELQNSPLYNSELSPPEMRGFLISLQQLSTTIGIMLAYWVTVGYSLIDHPLKKTPSTYVNVNLVWK
jgi:hypothetical protein